MANVLGELFGDIASAIREKTGEADTMKPAQFPEKILGIETGGSAGTSYKYNSYTFTATANAMTIENKLGLIPDLIIVYPGTAPTNGYLTMAFGFSQAMMNKIENASSLYPSKVSFVHPSISMMNYGSNIGFENNGSNANAIKQGHIRGVTATSITVGSTDSTGAKLQLNSSYTVCCISGIAG